jgi:hypothetical protein
VKAGDCPNCGTPVVPGVLLSFDAERIEVYVLPYDPEMASGTRLPTWPANGDHARRQNDPGDPT